MSHPYDITHVSHSSQAALLHVLIQLHHTPLLSPSFFTVSWLWWYPLQIRHEKKKQKQMHSHANQSLMDYINYLCLSDKWHFTHSILTKISISEFCFSVFLSKTLWRNCIPMQNESFHQLGICELHSSSNCVEF